LFFHLKEEVYVGTNQELPVSENSRIDAAQRVERVEKLWGSEAGLSG